MSKLERGIRVRVIRTQYKEIGPDFCGTVQSIYLDSIAVEIDQVRNPRSEYGWFYFKPKQLEIIKITETKGEQTIMDGNYRVALVSFLEGSNTDRAYEYACYDSSINVNDIVVVKSAHHGFGIATITNFVENVGQQITREIVCKADFTAFNNRIAARKRRDELRKDMAKRAAQMQEIALYKMLAQEDPAMADMVKEYTELLNGN